MTSPYLRILRKFIYPLGDSLRGIPIEKERWSLEGSQWWSADQLRALQAARLCALIQHVYKNVPYYRTVMREYGLHPSDIQTHADLVKFPILSKEIVQRENERLKVENFNASLVATRRTGGSTGEPLTYYHDRQTQAINRAAHRRGQSWSGVEWGEPMVIFMGGTLGLATASWTDAVRRLITRQTDYPAFLITKQNINEISQLLQKVRPRGINGYTSSLYYLATLIEEAGLTGLKIPAIFTTGETLHDIYRETIEHVFGGRAFDYYGFGEIQAVAYQCPLSNNYHLTDEKVVLELIPFNEGERSTMGRALITDLSNYSFPLIRYECGDVIELSDTPCVCGRQLTPVKRILGRTHDFIVSPSGNLLAGEFFPHLFRSIQSIRFYQVIQDEIDHLVIRYVPSGMGNLSADMLLLTRKITEYTGDSMQIDFEQVEKIPRTPSGKLRVAVSLIDPTRNARQSFDKIYTNYV